MKKTAFLLLLVLVAAGVSLSLTIVLADTPDPPPEFYFTRLAYTENAGGRRGNDFFGGFFQRGTMPVPNIQYTCPEFGG